jgi:hypothetical protein
MAMRALIVYIAVLEQCSIPADAQMILCASTKTVPHLSTLQLPGHYLNAGPISKAPQKKMSEGEGVGGDLEPRSLAARNDRCRGH